MARRDDDYVGGDGLNNVINRFSMGFIGTWAGVMAILVCGLLIAADVGLGPFFLIAQADWKDIDLTLISKVTPWIFSIAMTGLLYALWETIGYSYSKRWIKVLAIAINVADTVTDLGGANWLFTHDPVAGQRIWPLPESMSSNQKFFAITLAVLCFVHEPVLGWLVGQYRNAVDAAAEHGEPGFGEKIEKVGVTIGGYLLNVTKFVGKTGATFALPALDLILTPLMFKQGWNATFIAACVGSLVLTGFQSALWRRTREMGGIIAAIKLSSFDAIMVIGLGLLIVVDTYFDVRGYNKALYGENGNFLNIIEHPTQSWALTIGILAVICSFGELLSREVFTILGRRARSAGGGDDFDDFDGDDDEGDMPSGDDDEV